MVPGTHKSKRSWIYIRLLRFWSSAAGRQPVNIHMWKLIRRPPKLEEYEYKLMIFWFFRFLGLCSSSPDRIFIEFTAEALVNRRINTPSWAPFFWKIHFQHICQELNFCRGFMGNRLGQNDRIDRGIISFFHKKCDFDPCFAGQSPCFPENLNSYFLCLNNWFLFGGQICEALMCLEYRI